jgi:hypothetical protein
MGKLARIYRIMRIEGREIAAADPQSNKSG